jgi:hypothetical protein
MNTSSYQVRSITIFNYLMFEPSYYDKNGKL